MNENHIKNFLSKLESSLFKGVHNLNEIKTTIQDITKVKLKDTDFILRRGEIILKCSPIIKNQIFLKRELILDNLKQKGVRVVKIL